MPVIGALILAGGKGTRMQSPLPKVLQPLLNEPMLSYVLRTIQGHFSLKHTWILHGYLSEEIEKTFQEHQVSFIHQSEQLGTGHALSTAWESIQQEAIEYLFVINGDCPLLTQQHLDIFIQKTLENAPAIAFISTLLEDPAHYGRVCRDENNIVTQIVEAKEYSPKTHRETKEINTGIYAFHMPSIAPLLPLLNSNNSANEYYITDLIAIAKEHGFFVEGIIIENSCELLGVNTPKELCDTEEYLREKIVNKWQNKGVHIHQANSVRIGPLVRLSPGCSITGPCELYGTTTIGEYAIIESHTKIINSTISSKTSIFSFSHIHSAHIAENCSIGPYARLRPETILDKEVSIGNFVEIKKSTFGKGSKANHLTYIGDAFIGQNTNIGAGTITCNYDGKKKNITSIGNNVFVGSLTALIAPIEIGDSSIIGAGSVITQNVEANTLALSRTEQKVWHRKK